MKKILIAVGCLFLSACSISKQQPVGHLAIKCWQKDPDGRFSTVIYSGKTNGGIGMGEGADSRHVPFITFLDSNNKSQIILLTNRVCAAAVDSIDY